MSVRNTHIGSNCFYFITFTCFDWIPLFEITNLYEYIYECFDINKSKNIITCGYVIMPNHLHTIVYTRNTEDTINQIIGESKRFMAYEIINRLKESVRKALISLLHESVNPCDRAKGQFLFHHLTLNELLQKNL